MTRRLPSPKNRKPEQAEQLARFKEAARALECDDDPKAFRKVMEKIAKAKPKIPEENHK